MTDEIEDRADHFTWKPGDLVDVGDAYPGWHLTFEALDGDTVLVLDLDGLMQHFLQAGATDLQATLDAFMRTEEAQAMPQFLRAELANAGVLRE